MALSAACGQSGKRPTSRTRKRRAATRIAYCGVCRVQSAEWRASFRCSVFRVRPKSTCNGPRTTDHGQRTTDSQRPTTDNVPCATDCTLGLSNRLAGENACVGKCNRPGALCSAFLRVEKNSAVACLTSATRFAKCGGALRRGNFADICHRHFGVSALGRSGGAADRSSDGEARGGRRARVESNAPAK